MVDIYVCMDSLEPPAAWPFFSSVSAFFVRFGHGSRLRFGSFDARCLENLSLIRRTVDARQSDQLHSDSAPVHDNLINRQKAIIRSVSLFSNSTSTVLRLAG